MVRTYFPVSRLWAAAEMAGDDLAAFANEVPMETPRRAVRDRLQSALADTASYASWPSKPSAIGRTLFLRRAL